MYYNKLNLTGSKCKCTCNIVIFKELMSISFFRDFRVDMIRKQRELRRNVKEKRTGQAKEWKCRIAVVWCACK